MAEETTPAVPMPNPVATKGGQTSEYFITKVIISVATAAGILGAALEAANVFAGWLPDGSIGFKVIAIGGAVLAFLQATVYTLSRTRVKIAAMETGTVPDLTPEQAAEILDGKVPAPAKPATPPAPPPEVTP